MINTDAHLWHQAPTERDEYGQDWIGLYLDWSQFFPEQFFRVVLIRFNPISQICQIGGAYFAINGKRSAGAILLFELYPPLSKYNVEFVLLVARWM